MPTERPLLAYSYKDLEAGPKQVRAALPAAWLDRKLTERNVGKEEEEEDDRVALHATIDGAVDLRLSPTASEQFVLQGKASATLDTKCGRCLGPASVPLEAEITLLLVPEVKHRGRGPKGRTHQESEGEFEFDGSEADVAMYDGETVILDDLVVEALVLELPISPLCSETCAGMSADPAVAKTLATARIDPRLAPLAALSLKNEGADPTSDPKGKPGKSS